MDFSDGSARSSFLLCPLDLAQRLLLFGQGRCQGIVRIVGLESVRRQFLGHGHEGGLAEVLRAQLSHQRQPCRGEQHLLADFGGIWNVCHGNKLGRVVVAAEDGIEGDVWLDEWLQHRQILSKVGGFARDRLNGNQGFALDRHKQGKVGGRREQRAERLLELLGGCCRDSAVSSPHQGGAN